MELEGLIRCHEDLLERGKDLDELTTDRHSSINSYVNSNWPQVKHMFDIWHIAKGNATTITSNSNYIPLIHN